MHRGGHDVLLDRLEVIEALDGSIKCVAFLLLQTFFHFGNLVRESFAVEFLQRGRSIGENRQALVGDFRKTAKHDDLLVLAASGHRHDAGTNGCHQRRVSGHHAEIAIGAGDTVQFCPNGCFVTMPNGDREALNGSETIEISGGIGKIK